MIKHFCDLCEKELAAKDRPWGNNHNKLEVCKICRAPFLEEAIRLVEGSSHEKMD
jgi:hypothetical protein